MKPELNRSHLLKKSLFCFFILFIVIPLFFWSYRQYICTNHKDDWYDWNKNHLAWNESWDSYCYYQINIERLQRTNCTSQCYRVDNEHSKEVMLKPADVRIKDWITARKVK